MATEDEQASDQPGLAQLRETVANQASNRLPSSASLRSDGIAGLNTAINAIPNGMACGILAGVNPVYGLYACTIGPIIGGVLASSQLMIINTTSASAVAAGQALSDLPTADRERSLFLLAILAGLLLMVAGLLKLGRYTRFISYSVFTGFLAGVAVLLILSQLPTVTGYAAAGDNNVAKTYDLLTHLGLIDGWTLAVAAIALVLTLVLTRTAIGSLGSLIAIVVPSVFVAVGNLETVEIVRDVGVIPSGIPTPFVPGLSDVSLNVLFSALAVAIIILVQGAGVSQSVPNKDGSRASTSRDFLAQGAANVASGVFRGLPVGGSHSSTALSVVSGAQSRWAAVISGLAMAILVLGFPGVVSYIAMPALGALLIVAGVMSIKPEDLRSILIAGWPSVLVAVTTFVATLLLPIQAAVGYGIVLSALLYVVRSSTEIQLVQLIRRPDGRFEERTPPKEIPGDDVTVLDVYGNLFFAGARTLERMLPDPTGGQHPVVILRLRGQSTLGATLIDVLATYANELAAIGGRLYLTGVNHKIHDQIVESGKLRLTGPVRAYELTPIVGESTMEAYAEAKAWQVRKREGTASDADSDRAS
jgi:SulP family sulfate permease